MAIHTITTVQRYIGLSTDSKPDAIYNGSEFYEADTGQKFIWYDGNWVEDLSFIKAITDALL